MRPEVWVCVCIFIHTQLHKGRWRSQRDRLFYHAREVPCMHSWAVYTFMGTLPLCPLWYFFLPPCSHNHLVLCQKCYSYFFKKKVTVTCVIMELAQCKYSSILSFHKHMLYTIKVLINSNVLLCFKKEQSHYFTVVHLFEIVS